MAVSLRRLHRTPLLKNLPVTKKQLPTVNAVVKQPNRRSQKERLANVLTDVSKLGSKVRPIEVSTQRARLKSDLSGPSRVENQTIPDNFRQQPTLGNRHQLSILHQRQTSGWLRYYLGSPKRFHKPLMDSLTPPRSA